jgi:hypothetical protein
MKGSLYQLPLSKRAIWFVRALICIVFLAAALPIKAQLVFFDTFDYYSAGNLNGQGKWILYSVHSGATSSAEVNNTLFYSSPYSARITTNAGGVGSERPFTPTPNGSLSFMFSFWGYNGDGADYQLIYFNEGTGTTGNILGSLHCEQEPPACDTG